MIGAAEARGMLNFGVAQQEPERHRSSDHRITGCFSGPATPAAEQRRSPDGDRLLGNR